MNSRTGSCCCASRSSWCWPAHDDTLARHGAVLATIDDPFLDLGAGEVAGQLAWIDHLLGDALDERYPGLRRPARTRDANAGARTLRDSGATGTGSGSTATFTTGIRGSTATCWSPPSGSSTSPATSGRRSSGWSSRGSIATSPRSPPTARSTRATTTGGTGPVARSRHWTSSRHATGGRLDASQVPALRATVAFPHRMHLGGGWYVNFADSEARPTTDQPWHALHRAARAVGDLEAQASRGVASHPRSGRWRPRPPGSVDCCAG